MSNKVKYIDGFVLVVPKKNLAAYRKMAAVGGKLWKRHGAIDYKECMLDDMMAKQIKRTFKVLVKPKAGEVVFFSYIGYKSKAHRNAVNAKVMNDPAMTSGSFEKDMPFDIKRMSVAGFKVLVSN